MHKSLGGPSPALHTRDVVCMPVILALGRWEQDDQEFKVTFDYLVNSSETLPLKTSSKQIVRVTHT